MGAVQPTALNFNDEEHIQLREAINFAREEMFNQGVFWWDRYIGHILLSTGKTNYPITPEGSNLLTQTRDLALVSTLNNCTVEAKQGFSFDGERTLAKFTATGADPHFYPTSQTDVLNQYCTGSIWLKGDETNPPGTVTLSLRNSVTGALISKTIEVGSQLKRYSVSGLEQNASNTFQLQVGWTNTSGVIYADAPQIEIGSYASEMIDNAQSDAAQDRTVFCAPDRVVGVYPYYAGTYPTYLNEVYAVSGFVDQTKPAFLVNQTVVWLENGELIVPQATDGQHLVYVGYSYPKRLTAQTDTTTVPYGEANVMLLGARYYMLAALYDQGSNADVTRSRADFDKAVNTLLDSYNGKLGKTTISIDFTRAIG